MRHDQQHFRLCEHEGRSGKQSVVLGGLPVYSAGQATFPVITCYDVVNRRLLQVRNLSMQ